MKIMMIFLTCLFLINCSDTKDQKSGFGKNNQNDVASYLPQNNLDEQEFMNYGETGTTEQQFNQILDAIEQIYQPIVSNFGANLIIEREWENTEVNAYASQNGNNWIVSFFGGLAKRVDPESFSLVVCHELGHHLNGRLFYANSWASSEGGSDGYSTQVCARKIFSMSQDQNCECNFLPPNSFNQNYSQCNIFTDGDEKLICERSLKGGLGLAKLLASLNNEPVPNYNNLDKTRVTKTKLEHPSAKCRLTLYFNGALSRKAWNDSIIPRTKAQMLQYNFQTTPNCWYSGN